MREIPLSEEKRRWLGAAAGSEGHEDWPELRFERLLDPLPAMGQRVQDGSCAVTEHFFVGHQNKVLEALRVIGRVEQVGFAGGGESLQVFEGAERVRREVVLVEDCPVIG